MRSGLFIVREGRSSMALYDGATLIGTGRTAYLHPIAERIARERGWSKPVIAPDVSMGRVLRAWVPERNARTPDSASRHEAHGLELHETKDGWEWWCDKCAASFPVPAKQVDRVRRMVHSGGHDE